MPRPRNAASLEQIVNRAVAPIVQRTSGAIARAVAAMVAERLEAELRTNVASRRSPSRRRRGDIDRWTADRRARRVPNFVIAATGLKTKKEIVKKFGEGVTFAKGKPMPKAK